jgi:hypothetical protein
LRFNLGEISLWHGQLQNTCGGGPLNLRLLNQNIFRDTQLSDSALDVQSEIVWVQINVDVLSVHELGDFNLKDNAGLISRLIKSPLVLALVDLSHLALLVVHFWWSLL